MLIVTNFLIFSTDVTSCKFLLTCSQRPIYFCRKLFGRDSSLLPGEVTNDNP